MTKKSTQIALGGMFSALCLVLMFMTGMVPFASYAIPALAGAMLIPVMAEIGAQTAVLVYVAVGILGIFIVPDREAAMMFIVFFGYYPILKPKLDGIKLRLLRLLLKFLLFNVAVVSGYLVIIYVLGLPNMAADMGDFGKVGAAGLLAMGNVVFAVYDFAVARYMSLYVNWFKPKFLRR